jgi:hypothetical protein
MTYQLYKARPWLAVSLIAASMASAQDAGNDLPPGLRLEVEQQPLKNRFGLSYRPGFNINATFKNLGAFPPQTNPGPASGPADRFYDDGYVRRDGGANSDLTWFWGYNNNTQVPGDNTIQFHSSSSPGTGVSEDNSGSPQQGLELSYNRYFGKVGKRGSWGLEAGFNYNNVTISDSSPVNSSVSRLTDTYGLGGVIPPEAPYNGSFTGPGPLISALPTRSFATIPGGAQVTGRRNFDADMFGLRLGPYLEIPLDKANRFNVSFSGGLAVAVVSGDFSYSESTTIQNVGTVSSSGSGTDNEVLVGGFFGANFSYALNRSWSVFAGAMYQYLPTYSQTVNGREIELDFSKSVFVNLGFGFSF